MLKTLNGNIPCIIGINASTKNEQLSELCILPVDTKNDPKLQLVFDKAFILYNDVKVKTRRVVVRKDHSTIYDNLDYWFETNIGSNKILPIVYDWQVTRKLLVKFLGEESIPYYFKEDTIRDIKIVAQFLTDLAEENGHLKLPFPKTTLRYIANQIQEPMSEDPSVVEKAITISKIYKFMTTMNANSLTLSL